MVIRKKKVSLSQSEKNRKLGGDCLEYKSLKLNKVEKERERIKEIFNKYYNELKLCKLK